MIACNHHGAPEPHMWFLLTPGIDLWKATNRNGVPPEFFSSLATLTKEAKFPACFDTPAVHLKKMNPLFTHLLPQILANPQPIFQKRTFQKKTLDAQHWQPSWKTKCSSSPIDWRSGTFETGGWNERKGVWIIFRCFTMFYTKHSRWGVFRMSMPTMFSVEPRYIKWIFMNFSIFWHRRQLTHHPWINLKQPSQIWTTNMLSKAPCHDEVSNHLHFCKQVHQKQTPLGKCRCHCIQHNHNLKSHSCLGICRNMVCG